MTTGWRRVLMTTTAAGLICLAASTALAALVSGAAAAASAAAAGGLVVVLSFLSLGLIDWAERHRPQLAIPLFMIGFALKLAVLAMVLPAVRVGDWLDGAWALGAGTAVLLVWQVAEVMSFAKMRLAVSAPE
ncbi:hypothetical protein [Nesterenkonia alkaliphila]|uniref:ATP synthase protein I n=1 Tax=Nesterenkonia alkaliphila TaxID=1463631 RepID=A0A7K1UFU5_9MICC|nr:hypothetical protein [Nesterenkonia alkaliphila]MVT25340.1 hypothetical protein [Nesterenkonia alkaliphila]GFZ94461.1 hypothetical protein GCM10011359_24970 [Nesterenkonia alkaliphila]